MRMWYFTNWNYFKPPETLLELRFVIFFRESDEMYLLLGNISLLATIIGSTRLFQNTAVFTAALYMDDFTITSLKVTYAVNFNTHEICCFRLININEEPKWSSLTYQLLLSARDVHAVCLWDDKGPAKIHQALKEDILDFIKQAQAVSCFDHQ